MVATKRKPASEAVPKPEPAPVRSIPTLSGPLALTAAFIACCTKTDFPGHDGPGVVLSAQASNALTYRELIGKLMDDWNSVEHPWPGSVRPTADDIRNALMRMVPADVLDHRTYECRMAEPDSGEMFAYVVVARPIAN